MKRRKEEYEKNEKENKKTNEYIYPFLRKLFFYLKCENLMYDDFLNYYETYFHCVNYNTGERYYEIYYLMFFIIYKKNKNRKGHKYI